MPKYANHGGKARNILFCSAWQALLKLLVADHPLQEFLSAPIPSHELKGSFDPELFDMCVWLLVVSTTENAKLGELLW